MFDNSLVSVPILLWILPWLHCKIKLEKKLVQKNLVHRHIFSLLADNSWFPTGYTYCLRAPFCILLLSHWLYWHGWCSPSLKDRGVYEFVIPTLLKARRTVFRITILPGNPPFAWCEYRHFSRIEYSVPPFIQGISWIRPPYSTLCFPGPQSGSLCSYLFRVLPRGRSIRRESVLLLHFEILERA